MAIPHFHLIGRARPKLRDAAAGCRTIAAAALLAIGLGSTPALAGERPAKTGEIKPDLLYHNYCSVCHGDRGDGNSRAKNSLVPPPKDFTKATHLTRDYMIAIVANGKGGTAMVGWKTQLSDKEIEALVDYIMRSFMQTTLDPRLARGKSIYQQTCAVCHGDRGQGAVFAAGGMTKPPRDFTSPQAKLELSRERMLASVRDGRPGTAMASFGSQLPAADIEAVVDYVRIGIMNVSTAGTISGTSAHGGRERDAQAAAAPAAPAAAAPAAAPRPGTAPARADMSLAFGGGLKGDAAKGEKFYMDNCATCHGRNGDGKGPRAYFINPKPRNFVEERSRSYLNRPALYVAVAYGSVGTEMPAWRFVLSEQEMANVAEFVFQRFISAKGSAQAKPTAK